MHLELPSHYLPYNFKSVNLNENVGPAFISKFARSMEDDDMKPLLQAVQCAIDVDVNTLTEGDFYYTLTMMRLMVFKRNPLVARWQCNGGQVFERKDTGERWTVQQLESYVNNWNNAEDKEGLVDPDTIQVEVVACRHDNEEEVSADDLMMHTLPDPEEAPFVLDPRLDYPRAGLIPEAYDLSDDEDFGPFVRVAKWVRNGVTLLDKIELIQNDMSLYEAALHAERTYRHGISRYILKECRACGNPNTLLMEVKAASFL